MVRGAQDVCQYCHSRPRYVERGHTHPYCGRRCAQQDKQHKPQSQNDNSSSGMCDLCCGVKQKCVENGKTYPYCGRACASMAVNKLPGPSGLCDVCGEKPKYIENGKTYLYCGKTSAGKANQSSGLTPGQATKGGTLCDIAKCKRPVWVDTRSGKSSRWCSESHKKLATQLCLWCRKAGKGVEQDGIFCTANCADAAGEKAPRILEIPEDHARYESISQQFKVSWRHTGTTAPTIRHIYKVLIKQDLLSQYHKYREAVEKRGRFTKLTPPRASGNENRRWHGTRRECDLGTNGQIKLCTSSSCSLCNIIRTSFDLAYFAKNTSVGCFGKGIYTSSTSSKSNDYIRSPPGSNLHAILLNKVVVGRGFKMRTSDSSLTAPPKGYDSVLGEAGGQLNYDELVVYTNDAIRPTYLVLYDA